jgi:arylsulfatase A-like enzyme
MKKMICVKEWATAILVVLIAAATPVRADNSPIPPPADRKPSIILILADDLGYGDLGCYGQRTVRTPNIDQLAAEGMRFTSCYGGAAVSEPSRAALLTGLNTGHLSIRDETVLPQSLADGETIVSQYLHLAGYRTAFIGEWEVGVEGSSAMPTPRGFDESFGFVTPLEAEEYFPTSLYRHDRQGNDRRVIVSENEGAHGEYADDFFTVAALNIIRIDHPHALNKFRPIFLYLPYSSIHANTGLGQITGNGMQVPDDAPYTDQAWPQPEKNRAAMVTRLDNYVGHLMDQIKKYKIGDQTAVILTSDNGPAKEGGCDPAYFQSAGKLRGYKRDLHEGGIRVPFIVHWPASVKAGSTSDLPCALWDVLPTLMDIARLEVPTNIDGISLLPTLTGVTQTNRHEFLYWEAHQGGFRQAVRMGDWKALRTGVDGALELYNLASDPSETTDVASQHPDITARITEYLKTARTPDEKWPARTVAENAKPASLLVK